MAAEYGDCIVMRHDDGRLRIKHADPRVLISPGLLEEIARNPPGSPATFDGKVLRIRAENQTVIYVITGREPGGYSDPCLIGEWPD